MQIANNSTPEKSLVISSKTKVSTPHGSVFEYPVEKCCGVDRLYCWSTKLHAALFVVSIIFVVLYTLTTVGGFLLLSRVRPKDNILRIAVVSLCVSTVFQLLSSVSLLLSVIKRTNILVILYISGNMVSLLAFFVAAVEVTVTMLLPAIIMLACDVAMICILRRFMIENHLFTSMLAEKRRRFNRELRIQGTAQSFTETESDETDGDLGTDSGTGTGSEISV